MSLRDTFIRVNRHRATDHRTGFLSAVAIAVLDQVWAIAMEEGEGEVVGRDDRGRPLWGDVLVATPHLDAQAVLMELPRHPDFTPDSVAQALQDLTAVGCLSEPSGGLIAVHKLGAYNSPRLSARDRQREFRASRDSTPALPPGHRDTRTGHGDKWATVGTRTGGAGAGAGAGEEKKLPNGGRGPRKPRKEPTGPLADFIRWFEDAYERELGSKYVGRWSKEAPQAARLLKDLGPEELRARALRLLRASAGDDPWLVTTDRGIGVLSAAINKPALLGQNGHRKPKTDEAPLR